MKNKNIITIETSLGRIFIAVIKNNQIFSTCMDSPRSIEQELTLLINKLMIEANLKFNEINLIFVSLGPGSFTGIRIGISAAKAISLCTEAKIIGFSNFDVIFYQFIENKKNSYKEIEVLIKGPGNEFYKKKFSNNKPGKKNYLIKNIKLHSEKLNEDVVIIGNFVNSFKFAHAKNGAI